MRERVSGEALEQFMKAVGRAGRASARIYFVGGATAVLLGWRDTTIDIDLKLVPEVNDILKALPALKERLEVNVDRSWVSRTVAVIGIVYTYRRPALQVPSN